MRVEFIEEGWGHLTMNFAQQHLGEESSTHADAPMDTPDGKLDAGGMQRVLPRRNMLVHAIDQRSVEIKEEADAALGHAVSRRWLLLPARNAGANVAGGRHPR